MSIGFAKGHGTGNDFVILPDPDADLDLSPEKVTRLCDRRFGIGGDGVLRVVRSTKGGFESSAEWFMDYRNADGSVAEMCGNGARVFAQYLREEGLVADDAFAIGTRGGDRPIRFDDSGNIVVGMGVATRGARGLPIALGETKYDAAAVWIPNPHAVVDVADLDVLPQDLSAVQVPTDHFPDGANVEFVAMVGSDHAQMRVQERGVGETLSCGTGICAVAVHLWDVGAAARDRRLRVDVPGGTCYAEQVGDTVELIGPAVIVARGQVSREWMSV